jgi:hypothetical protein
MRGLATSSSDNFSCGGMFSCCSFANENYVWTRETLRLPEGEIVPADTTKPFGMVENVMRPSDDQDAAKPENTAERRWVLIGRFSGNTSTHVVLDPLPFVIGRRPNVSLTLARPTISGLHAEFY